MALEPDGRPESGPPTALESALESAGETGQLLLAIDWSATALGPMASWPQLLRRMVATAVLSPLPTEVSWGPDLVFLYNDAVRPLLGSKHPRALGRPKRLVFPEVWDTIGPIQQSVLEQGRPASREDAGFLLDRRGFPEECYFTFSHAPIIDESGVAGIFSTVTETTARVVDARRLRTLSALGECAGTGRTTEAACAAALEVLATNERDVPFALVYLAEADGRRARLAARAGLEAGRPLAPETITTTSPQAPWPVGRALAHLQPVVEPLDPRMVAAAGRWEHGPAPRAALVVPLRDGPGGRPSGAAVLGVNPALRLDAAQRGFLEMVGRQLSVVIGGARAHEAERARAELLADMNRAKTQFLGNVSHELRTPLTLVLGPLSDCLADPAAQPAVQRRRIELALRSARRLSRLVDRLLDFSRIEEGRMEAAPVPVDLSALTAEVAGVFGPAVSAAGLRLVVDCPPLGQPVYVDRELWEKALLNLVSNAVKFTERGEIRVACRRVGRRAEVVVADTGVGVPADELPHLFERFHQARSGWARSSEGVGIGLALVKETVELHGGSLKVQSREGRGTTFTVTLPLGRRPPAPPPALWTSLPSASSREARRTIAEVERWTDRSDSSEEAGPAARPRVLVVEDDPDMRRYVLDLLRPHWRVEGCADGRQALAAARARLPDLVLADVMLPAMDGFELLRQLRAAPRTSRVPVILLSARAGGEATVEGLAAGADDYLVKPFSAEELVARLRTHLELSRARESQGRHAERQRVARELHDSVLQTLYGIALGAESIRSLATQDPGATSGVAQYLLQLARSALEEMRALILELRPDALEHDGLVTSLRRLVAPMASRHGLRVALELGDEPSASLEAKEALLRIAQEALQNVARHAGAGTVSVRLRRDDALTLEVADDGSGFDVAGEHAGHLGQTTMRERAELVGGALEVISAPGRGTRVVARVPAGD
ncbi:MAG TPA: ATP-binding protein [Candidatus Eisenbacteria bacterium]|nr:ATP-binding protein [Candidatus Eisenbacteria bacterium]